MSRVFIIAEAGVNHNGSLMTAKRLIDAAAEAGADAVKFQTFKAGSVVSIYAPKARYQKKTAKGRTQFAMLKRLELDKDAHVKLIGYCRRRNILFLSSPFDTESLELLVSLGLGILKIPSGEITNIPYLKKAGSFNKKIIMSTGMADLEEVKNAMDILVASGTKKENITLLHCTTEYPAPYEDVNLKAMLAMRDKFRVTVGYSDHTLGIEVPIAAVALGAAVIEKHFTLGRNMAGPDHKASAEPGELKAMVTAIRNIEKAMGGGIKKPAASEIKNRDVVRKYIVAAKDIRKGEVVRERDIALKRAGAGIDPGRSGEVIGKISKRDFKKDELIRI